MLDCPEQSHTSPTITFCRMRFRPSLTVMVYGPPACGVRSVVCQLPCASAFVVAGLLSQDGVTVTVFPGFACPQTGTSVSCCRTMLSVNSCGMTGCAASCIVASVVIIANNVFFIVLVFWRREERGERKEEGGESYGSIGRWCSSHLMCRMLLLRMILPCCLHFFSKSMMVELSLASFRSCTLA